jgi:hypothetical protein
MGVVCCPCLVICGDETYRSSYSSAFRKRLISHSSEFKDDWILAHTLDDQDRKLEEEYTVGRELVRLSLCVSYCVTCGCMYICPVIGCVRALLETLKCACIALDH